MDFSVGTAAGGTWIVNIIDSIMIMILVSLADNARVTIFDLRAVLKYNNWESIVLMSCVFPTGGGRKKWGN